MNCYQNTWQVLLKKQLIGDDKQCLARPKVEVVIDESIQAPNAQRQKAYSSEASGELI